VIPGGSSPTPPRQSSWLPTLTGEDGHPTSKDGLRRLAGRTCALRYSTTGSPRLTQRSSRAPGPRPRSRTQNFIKLVPHAGPRLPSSLTSESTDCHFPGIDLVDEGKPRPGKGSVEGSHVSPLPRDFSRRSGSSWFSLKPGGGFDREAASAAHLAKGTSLPFGSRRLERTVAKNCHVRKIGIVGVEATGPVRGRV